MQNRRRKRSRRLKQLIQIVILSLMFITIVGSMVLIGTSSKDNSMQGQNIASSVVKKKTQKQKESVRQETQESEETELQEETEVKTTQKSENDLEIAPIVYEFKSTSDTVTIENEEIISSNIILVDESKDMIIAQKGAKERIVPASMTKVLTILVAAEHISQEDLDNTFTITLDITDYAYENDCSSVGFQRDEVVKVRDLFYGTILPSGGDAAVGLATYVAGSHEAFVELMNEKLEELGLSDTAHFTNCVGLYNDDHYCSVYDMAIIMKAALQNEFCKEVLSTRCYTTTPTEQHPEGITISNWFLRRIEDKDNDSGGEVIAGKTGYVVQSGNCSVSYGTFANGTPYICATTGSSSSWQCIYDHVNIYTKYIPKVVEQEQESN